MDTAAKPEFLATSEDPTTDRPYREALPHNEALSIPFSEAESGWLDTNVVQKFAWVSKGHEYFPIRGRTMLASYHA